jgi:DnaJ-class molecular chaperone
MEKEKPITSDLFSVDTCDHCNGEGQIEVKNNITEDCDICKGSGMLQ